MLKKESIQLANKGSVGQAKRAAVEPRTKPEKPGGPSKIAQKTQVYESSSEDEEEVLVSRDGAVIETWR